MVARRRFLVGNAELDEVAPTFRELLEGSGVSFVQACVDDVDLAGKTVSVVGALSDDLEGFMVSDNAGESERVQAPFTILPFCLRLHVPDISCSRVYIYTGISYLVCTRVYSYFRV